MNNKGIVNIYDNHNWDNEIYLFYYNNKLMNTGISVQTYSSIKNYLTVIHYNFLLDINVQNYIKENPQYNASINYVIKSFKKIQNEIMETRMLNITQQQLEKIDIGMYEDILNNLGGFKEWFPSPPGKEHYRLLIHISNMFNNINILDVGTNYGCSALALANNPSNKVISYDIVKHPETEHIKCSNIEFRIGNVLYNEEVIKNSKLIMLDTAHDGTFENEFYNKLKEIQWEGMLLLDDIKLNNAMEQFWKNIHHVKYDLTHLGHFTGTGLVMFSNNG